MNQRIAERIWPILTSKPALVFYAGLCCFLLAIFNIFIAEHNNFISIWMVNAVLLIFIFRSKPALSWYYFLAGLIATTLANLVAGGPLLISFQVALCNSLEILIPILLVQRSVESPVLINSFNRQVIALAYALPLGCLCSALTVTMLTNEPSNPYTPVIILNWFSIDLLAMISILPIGLSATYDRFKKLIQPRKMLELILSVTVAVLLTWVSMRYIQIRFIIMLIPLLYGTFRLGLLGTSIMCFSITAVFAVNLIISQTNHQLYSTIPELISYSFLLMSITLMPALITAILIEQRDLFQDKLGENEELFRGVILYSSIGMALVSPDGKWTLVNPALSDITGYDQDELLKMKLEDITNKEYVLHDSDMVSRVIKHDILSYQVDKRCIKKNGETIWVSQVIYGIYDAAGKIINYVIQIEDITLRKQLQLQLKNQATHDMLTGLTNRREIENKIQKLIDNVRVNQDTNLFFYIDLDKFKIVNDSAGHAAGDDLLRRVADMLATSVRSTDTVARLGGDEFAILLPSCTAMGGSVIAYEIINKIMNYHFMWDGRVYQIGASVGIVSFKSMELTMEKLLSHADVACYAAKHQGGNRVCFFDDLNKDGTN